MKMKQSIFLIIVLAGSLIVNLDAYYFCKKSVIEKNCKIPCNYNICSNDENACNHLNKFKNLTKHGLRRFHNKVKFQLKIVSGMNPNIPICQTNKKI